MSKTNGNILSANEISTFCAQLSMIIKSGIPVGDGLAIMQEDVHNSDGKEILGVIQSHAEIGEPLYLCLAATNKFPPYLLNMVEIGELSGKLDNVFDSLCEYYEREEGIAKSVKSAITYPLVMIVIMLLVIGVL
ncbi:MAG: type II secretion system F family protein, partial [Oscillospiraceae bacterium]